MNYELLLPRPRRDRVEGSTLPKTLQCNKECDFYKRVGEIEICTYRPGFRFLFENFISFFKIYFCLIENLNSVLISVSKLYQK